MTIYKPWHTPFPSWKQSVVPCPVLTFASWSAYRFLKRQVRWCGMPISFRIFHSLLWSVKGFGIVNKAEIDVFLKLSCFFDDPMDVGNLISGSSAFSKTSLNIWKFMVHVLLKLSLVYLKCAQNTFVSIWAASSNIKPVYNKTWTSLCNLLVTVLKVNKT